MTEQGHSLETEYLGLRLASPIVPGASPLADELDVVLRLEDAGAPMITMRSLFEEQLALDEHAARAHVTHAGIGGESTRSYLPATAFAMGVDRYLGQLERIRRRVAVPVVASLNGATPGGWVDHARMLEQAGASALELNLYALPSNPDVSAAEVERAQLEVVRSVVSRVTIPVAVKLSPFYSSLPHFVRAIEGTGAKGVVLFNRFYQADLDPIALTTRRTLHLSTSSELLLRLRWLALLSPRARLSLAASGGVHQAVDAIKALMTGATIVQVVSVLLLHGPERLRVLVDGLREHLEREEYTSLAQMRGNMNAARSPDPSAYERADYVQVLSSWHGMVPSRAGGRVVTPIAPTAEAWLPSGLAARLLALLPGARIVKARALGDDDAGSGATEAKKELGYGRPIRVDLVTPSGPRTVVVHTARANDFGHDRRADRADAMLLAYDSFPLVPNHVRALDVGAIRSDGTLLPLGDTGELYLVTEWAEGGLYADDLRRVAETGVATELDLARAEALARHLASMHSVLGSHPGAYVRALRDLVGHGEGIAGIADAYADDTPFAPRARIEGIERSALAWRHRLKRDVARLRRTHGDFHPFNLVFAAGSSEPILLDTSRGSEGEPADDVAALSINYLFFGLAHRERWASGLGKLWERFFDVYVACADQDVLGVIAPFYAWRGLVIACPLWYPSTREADRDRILGFVERTLAAPRFELAWGPEAMR